MLFLGVDAHDCAFCFVLFNIFLRLLVSARSAFSDPALFFYLFCHLPSLEFVSFCQPFLSAVRIFVEFCDFERVRINRFLLYRTNRPIFQ